MSVIYFNRELISSYVNISVMDRALAFIPQKSLCFTLYDCFDYAHWIISGSILTTSVVLFRNLKGVAVIFPPEHAEFILEKFTNCYEPSGALATLRCGNTVT